RSHAEARPVRGRVRRCAPPRHAALPTLPDGALLGARVRVVRGPRAVSVAARLLPVPARAGRGSLPGSPAHGWGERHPRARHARAQDGREVAGRHGQRPGPGPGPPVGGPLGRPRSGQAARPQAARRRGPADLLHVAARDAGLGNRLGTSFRMTALKGSVLLFRFLLELAALAAVAYWGWHVSDGPVRYVAAIVTPIAFATAWGLFASPKATFKPTGLEIGRAH